MTHLPSMSHSSGDTQSRRNRGYALLETDSELERLGAESLFEQIMVMKKDVAYLNLENDLFQRYLEKYNPELLLGITKQMNQILRKPKITFEQDNSGSATGGGHDGSGSRADRRSTRNTRDADTMSTSTVRTFLSSSRSRTSSFGNRLEIRISYLYRADMCDMDKDMFYGQIQDLRHSTKSKLREMAAMNESLRMDRDESIKTMAELSQFLHHSSGKQMSAKDVSLEHFLAFVENWVKNGNAIVEQMRLRTATLRMSRKQKLQALAIKKELSGILRPIDFEQLQIEKVQLMRQLEENQSQFTGLKRLASEVSQIMITQKNQLEKYEARLLTVDTALEKRKEDTERYCLLCDTVEQEREEWENSLEKLKLRKDTHIVPSIDEYISSKSTIHELDLEFKVLERKFNISVIQLKGQRSKLAQIKKLQEQTSRKRAASAARFKAMKDAVGKDST